MNPGGFVMKKVARKVIITTACILLISVITAAAALVLLKIKTDSINDDYTFLYEDSAYSEPVYAEGVDLITQDVSCGYAVLEMFAGWSGDDSITEESLYDEYGKVVTSTGKSFLEQMNLRFPQYTTTMNKYMTNSELIEAVYGSLQRGIPVPCEWAALYEDTWTLHYSLIIGIDIPNDQITVANPYGYIEQITLDEFLSRTRFDAYEDMPLFLKLAFAFGLFEENTVFIAQ